MNIPVLTGREHDSASSNGRTSASDAEDVSSILSAGTSAELSLMAVVSELQYIRNYDCVAKWKGNGLQLHERRFKSCHSLHYCLCSSVGRAQVRRTWRRKFDSCRRHHSVSSNGRTSVFDSGNESSSLSTGIPLKKIKRRW